MFGRALSEVAVPVVLAAALAAVVSFDPLLSTHHPLWHASRDWHPVSSLLWSMTTVLLLGTVVLLIRGSAWLFEHRYPISTGLLIVAGAINGINLGTLDAFEFIFFLTTFFWMLTALVENRPIYTPRLVLAALMALAVLAFASMVNGGLTTLVSLRSLYAKLVLVFLLTSFVTSPALFRLAVKTLLVVALVSAVVAITTQLLYFTTGYEFSTADTPRTRYKPTPFGQFLRATGFTQGAQNLGRFIIVGMGIALLAPVRGRYRVPMVAVLFLALFLTFSTGAILTGCIMLALAPFALRPAYSLHYVFAGSALILTLYVSGAWDLFYDQVLGPMAAPGVDDRSELARLGWEYFHRHPVLGAGLMNFERVLTHPIHNAYFQAAFETGVVSALVYVSLIVYLIVTCYGIARRTANRDDAQMLKGMIFATVGSSIHSMTEPSFLDLVAWVCLGLLASAVSVYARRETSAPPAIPGAGTGTRTSSTALTSSRNQ